MRNPEYQFIETNVDPLVSLLVQGYEQITGGTVQPASPERLFIQWVASILTHERVLNNYTGNQNIPSRADGENLDALAELMYLPKRPPAATAVCTQRFHISEPQLSAILVPAGTRVTSPGGLIWETVEDVYIKIGDTYADAQIRCQTVGAAGNGYTPGQLNTLKVPLPDSVGWPTLKTGLKTGAFYLGEQRKITAQLPTVELSWPRAVGKIGTGGAVVHIYEKIQMKRT